MTGFCEKLSAGVPDLESDVVQVPGPSTDFLEEATAGMPDDVPDFVQGCTSTGSSTDFSSELSSRVSDDDPDVASTGSSTGFSRLYKPNNRILGFHTSSNQKSEPPLQKPPFSFFNLQNLLLKTTTNGFHLQKTKVQNVKVPKTSYGRFPTPTRQGNK